MVTVGVDPLDASSSPPEWVSSEMAEEVSSSSITLVDEGGMALIKGRVSGVGGGA